MRVALVLRSGDRAGREGVSETMMIRAERFSVLPARGETAQRIELRFQRDPALAPRCVQQERAGIHGGHAGR